MSDSNGPEMGRSVELGDAQLAFVESYAAALQPLLTALRYNPAATPNDMVMVPLTLVLEQVWWLARAGGASPEKFAEGAGVTARWVADGKVRGPNCKVRVPKVRQ